MMSKLASRFLGILTFLILLSSLGRFARKRGLHSELIPFREHLPSRAGWRYRKDLSLLIGVFSTAERGDRRRLLRQAYARAIKSDQVKSHGGSVTVKFVVGSSANTKTDALLAKEINQYKDLIVLDSPENMNRGKSYQFFKRVADEALLPARLEQEFMHLIQPGSVDIHASKSQSSRYDFVMKLDDDSYAHLPNVIRALQPYKAKKGIYFGRICNKKEMPTLIRRWPYMCGLGYALSQDLVQWLASEKTIDLLQDRPSPFEDANIGYWLDVYNKTSHLIDNPDTMFDVPPDGRIENIRQDIPKANSLVLHELKTDERMDYVIRWYYDRLREHVL